MKSKKIKKRGKYKYKENKRIKIKIRKRKLLNKGNDRGNEKDRKMAGTK